MLFWAFFKATAFVACFPAMAALGDPLRRKVRAVDRGEVYPDSDRQEGSHGAAQPKQHCHLASNQRGFQMCSSHRLVT